MAKPNRYFLPKYADKHVWYRVLSYEEARPAIIDINHDSVPSHTHYPSAHILGTWLQEIEAGNLEWIEVRECPQ